MAVDALLNTQWIPYKADGKQPEHGNYLVTAMVDGREEVDFDYFWSGGWDDYGDDVIAYMKIPLPYRKEEDTDHSRYYGG